MTDQDQTPPGVSEFDFSAYPPDTLFLDRRTLADRRDGSPPDGGESPTLHRQPRPRQERRRRIDPTTFEKQYTGDEIEFMTAIQRFKERSGKSFPSHGDILEIAHTLGYRQGATGVEV